MHVCHAIYRLGFVDYLSPIATILEFGSLKQEFLLKAWSHHDEFLLMFTDAAVTWLQGT
jgi:hypothetical protein